MPVFCKENYIRTHSLPHTILTNFFDCRVDDIEDNSILRRGIPVAHSIYGVASTINAANYVYFLGLEKVLSLNHPQVNDHRKLPRLKFLLIISKTGHRSFLRAAPRTSQRPGHGDLLEGQLHMPH